MIETIIFVDKTITLRLMCFHAGFTKGPPIVESGESGFGVRMGKQATCHRMARSKFETEARQERLLAQAGESGV